MRKLSQTAVRMIHGLTEDVNQIEKLAFAAFDQWCIREGIADKPMPEKRQIALDRGITLDKWRADLTKVRETIAGISDLDTYGKGLIAGNILDQFWARVMRELEIKVELKI